MKVYILLIKDRRADADVRVFSSPGDAIKAAGEYLKNINVDIADIEQRQPVREAEGKLNSGDMLGTGGAPIYKSTDSNAASGRIVGWLFYATYSSEGDSIRVEEKEIL